MESTLDQKQGHYYETDSVEVLCEVSELAASAAPTQTAQTLLYTPTEHYGSWAQYEQIQYQSTTVFQSSQTPTDQVSDQHYVYPPQESQVLEGHTSMSAAETAQCAVSSTTQAYDVGAQLDPSEAYGPPLVPATTAYDSVTSFTSYASAHSQQTAETAYTAPEQMQQSALASQGLPGQPMYMTQTVTDNQFQAVPSSTPSWLPAQAPILVQAQYTVQGGVQTGGSPYQAIVVGPDGQHSTQVPLTPATQGAQTIVYQVGPNGIQYLSTQSATGQMMVQTQQQPSSSGRKIWNKETAVQAKEATINATKKAYGKSKEFIVNKDGARAVAKTTWRQSKDVMVKTTDMMDKYVKPLMPFIAAADPELAASLRATSQVGRIVKAQDRKQNSAQGKNGPGVGSGAAQQNAAQPQLDAAALANLAPLLALLQQTTQLNAASGTQQGNDAQAQARLLAALLQVQQEQPQQHQIQQPQIQQPQIQQPQSQPSRVQQPYVHQQQQQQQYQVQQPFSQQQPKTTQAHFPEGQTQQSQIQQPVNGQPNLQQQVQQTHPQSHHIQQQVVKQPQQWQQPTQQPHPHPQQQQQKQQRVPRRKPISSNSASHQSIASQAPSTSSTASQANPDQLASFVDSHLTLQELPWTQDQPKNTKAATWTHHAFRAFGIEDILLPPGADITQFQTPPHTVIGKLLPETDATFEIEPFPNSTLLQQRIDALQSIPMSGLPPNPTFETQLLEPLAVRPELNPSALVAADCLVGLSAGQRTSYKVLLQSSAAQGYGISIASTTGASAKQAAKDAVRRMAGSLRWASALENGEAVSS